MARHRGGAGGRGRRRRWHDGHGGRSWWSRSAAALARRPWRAALGGAGGRGQRRCSGGWRGQRRGTARRGGSGGGLPLAVAKILRALAPQESPGLVIVGKQRALVHADVCVAKRRGIRPLRRNSSEL